MHDSHLDVIVSLANDQGVIFKMAQCEDDILVPFPVNHFVLISRKYYISCSQLYETCYNRLQKKLVWKEGSWNKVFVVIGANFDSKPILTTYIYLFIYVFMTE